MPLFIVIAVAAWEYWYASPDLMLATAGADVGARAALVLEKDRKKKRR